MVYTMCLFQIYLNLNIVFTNIVHIFKLYSHISRFVDVDIGLKNCLHSSIEESLMERVNQFLKDRIESFDDYYPYL